MDKEPDFLVIGMQKSGTYWVTALLDAHPEINCFPAMYGGQSNSEEVHLFDDLASIDQDNGKKFKDIFNRRHNGFFSDLTPYLNKVNRNELYDLFRKRYNQFCNLQRKKRLVGEKTAEYVLHLGIVDYFYPKIKKLCIIRDPKDRIVSFHFHQLRKRKKFEEQISDEYVKDYCKNRIKKEYETLLAYKGSVNCFTYEALSKEPDRIINGVLDYLGVASNKEIVESMITEGSFKSLTKKNKLIKDKIRNQGEEFRKSHYRKGVVGDWINHLNKKQVDITNSILSDLEQKVFEKYNLISELKWRTNN